MKGIKGEVVALGDTLKNYVIGVGIKDNNFTSSLKNMGGKLSTFVGQMGLLLGAGSLGMAFKKFIDTGTDISNFSALTGIAEKDISALGGVLEKFGGNVDNAKSSLQSLQQGLSQYQSLRNQVKYAIANLFIAYLLIICKHKFQNYDFFVK